MSEKGFMAFLSGYSAQEKKDILERLESVEKRGRYKQKG